jgi:hypothetical protein
MYSPWINNGDQTKKCRFVKVNELSDHRHIIQYSHVTQISMGLFSTDQLLQKGHKKTPRLLCKI